MALGKHVAKKHKMETDKELSQWQITKRRAKAAHSFKGSHLTSAPSPPPPKAESGLRVSDTDPDNQKNIRIVWESTVMKTNNVTEKLEKHMATPHTPGKRHKASNDYIYIN